MSYPGPPGVSSGSSHPSLPPRPPPSTKPAAGFKPAFKPAFSPVASAPGYPATSGPNYPSPAAPSYGAPPTVSAYSQPPSVGGGGRGGYNYSQNYAPQQQQQQQQPPPNLYGGANSNSSYSNPPQIRNPFPQPGAAAAPGGYQPATDYDAETAAQIAQWQNAYMPKDHAAAEANVRQPGGSRGGGGGALGPNIPGNHTAAVGNAVAYSGPPAAAGADVSGAAAAAAAGGDGAAAGQGTGDKKQTVYRAGGGKKWQDDTLLEWDPSHPRLFVGNLAGETTDESLLKAFARWPSVTKAKVIRDKRTNKSKGYGFVAFSNSDEFFQAAREMNGKYIQSHPVVIRKANTEIKVQAVKDDRKKGKKGGNKSGSGGGGGGGGEYEGGASGGAGSYDARLGPSGGGISKAGQKTRGGLKILG